MTAQPSRIRDLGYTPGELPTGPSNSILDVPGTHICQVTIPTSSDLGPDSTATKGVTVICPRPPEEFYKPCLASIFTFNGNGELTGSKQIADWGFINTPIAFTNSLSLGLVYDVMWQWILDQQDKFGWDSLTKARHYGTCIVGETADWIINSDTRQSRLEQADVRKCFEDLKSREGGAAVLEGQHGGGAGMTTHSFTGGTGTASRLVGDKGKGKQYVLGALCQSNYGLLADLSIGGVPIGKLLSKEQEDGRGSSGKDLTLTDSKDFVGRTKDGSILILIMTNAPLATHQLNRIARHATVGLAQVGTRGIGRTFSGDIFLAVSTAEQGPEQLDSFPSPPRPVETYKTEVVKNESIDAFFYATAEAVEEAVLNCMVAASSGTVATDGTKVAGLPVDRVKDLLEKHLVRL